MAAVEDGMVAAVEGDTAAKFRWVAVGRAVGNPPPRRRGATFRLAVVVAVFGEG